MSHSNDVIVIGGGVVGTSIAWHLARKGASVTLIEERAIAAAASGASAGGVRQQGRDPREMPLAIAAIARWENLEEELDADIHYYREGHIKVYDEATAPAAHQSVAEQRALGLDIAVVEGQDLRELVPGLAPSFVAGTYTFNDGHANPGLTTQAFANAAVREGATIKTDIKVTGLVHETGRVTGVETTSGVFTADHVILATGAWTRELVSPLGIELPINPAGLQMILSKPMPKRNLLQVVGAHERPLSLKQLREGNYLIGGGFPGDVDMVSGVGRTRSESIKGSLETAAAVFPLLEGMEIERSWVGVEGIGIDEIPVIDQLPGYEGITIAAGFSGHGFALSPITGQLVAEQLIDGTPSIPLDAFSMSRFEGMDLRKLPTPSAG